MIEKLNWDDSYGLGVRSLDRDHRRLFDAVNALIDEIHQGNRGATVQEMLDLLLEDVVEHFEREERALERVACPQLEEHRMDHYLLLGTVLRFKSKLKFDRVDSAVVAQFLVNWVRTHLVEQDLPCKPYLDRCGRN